MSKRYCWITAGLETFNHPRGLTHTNSSCSRREIQRLFGNADDSRIALIQKEKDKGHNTPAVGTSRDLPDRAEKVPTLQSIYVRDLQEASCVNGRVFRLCAIIDAGHSGRRLGFANAY